METMIISLLPVFLILTVGILIRKLNILSQEVMDGLKTIIIQFALTGVLLMTFARSDMKGFYICFFLLFSTLCAWGYVPSITSEYVSR